MDEPKVVIIPPKSIYHHHPLHWKRLGIVFGSVIAVAFISAFVFVWAPRLLSERDDISVFLAVCGLLFLVALFIVGVELVIHYYLRRKHDA